MDHTAYTPKAQETQHKKGGKTARARGPRQLCKVCLPYMTGTTPGDMTTCQETSGDPTLDEDLEWLMWEEQSVFPGDEITSWLSNTK